MKVCSRCAGPLPRIRTPTSARQMVWGGWTCPHCGTEINALGQPIDGTPVFAHDHVRITLHSPGEARYRTLVILGGLVAPLLGVGGLLLLLLLGVRMIVPVVAVMGLLMVGGIRGMVGLAQTHAVTVSDRAIRWGKYTVRPEAIRAVEVQGRVLRLHTDTETFALEPVGGTAALETVIAQARQARRAWGSPRDIPTALWPHRQQEPSGR